MTGILSRLTKMVIQNNEVCMVARLGYTVANPNVYRSANLLYECLKLTGDESKMFSKFK